VLLQVVVLGKNGRLHLSEVVFVGGDCGERGTGVSLGVVHIVGGGRTRLKWDGSL
jgi:hypothetical protein